MHIHVYCFVGFLIRWEIPREGIASIRDLCQYSRWFHVRRGARRGEQQLSCCGCCTPLPCCIHNPPDPSSDPSRPPVPTLSKVQTAPQTLGYHNRIIVTFDVPACNFIQVLWGLKGAPPVQEKIDMSGSGPVSFTAEPTEPGATYSFSAQACMNITFSPARCSPWSVPVDVTARDNLHRLVKFYLETEYGEHGLTGIPPGKNYPVPVRWLLDGSEIVPYRP